MIEKIFSNLGGFSIILVLNFVNCISGGPISSYGKGLKKARRNKKSERRQGEKLAEINPRKRSRR